MPRKEQTKRVYEVINKRREYENEEERKKALSELKRDLIMIFQRHGAEFGTEHLQQATS